MTNESDRYEAQPSRIFTAGLGTAELFNVGDVPLARVTYLPGFHWYHDWREATRSPEWCQRRHAGVVVSGHLRLNLDDGSSMDCVAGEAYDIPPGHDGWVVGDEPWVAIDSEAHKLFAFLDEQ